MDVNLLNHTGYYLFVPRNAHIYINILNFTTNAPTFFGVSAPSSGSFDVAFAGYKILKLLKLHKSVDSVYDKIYALDKILK
jgi:hypothetical protein